jgi:rfaE bifunctional protein kinase chain/domain
MKKKLLSLLGKFKGKRVGVIGDVVADVYISGTPTRISREAPVLIIRHEEEWLVPGSAANAAANLLALGADVRPVGLIGDDSAGDMVRRYFRERGVDVSGLVSAKGTGTTTKMRVLAGDTHTSKQQVVRVDREFRGSTPEARGKLDRALASADDYVDAWLVSDYGYGTINENSVKILSQTAKKGKLVVGDSRYLLGTFNGFTLVTPNEEEAGALAGAGLSEDAVLASRGETLRKRFNWKALLVTRGNRGMALFQSGKKPAFIPIAGSADIVDVSGAGDTVAAAATLALLGGASFLEAAHIANFAASVVVMKRGTATLNIGELSEAIKSGKEPAGA